MKYIMVLFLALFTVGCNNATYSNMTGSGPITFSQAAQKSYDEYLRSNPRAFAVTEDGHTSWGYYYCGDSECRGTSHDSMPKAIRSCERYSKGKFCKIYDVGGNVVWDKKVRPEEAVKVDLYNSNDFEISTGQKVEFDRYLDLVSIKNSDVNLAFAISKNGEIARTRSQEVAPYNKLKLTVLEICRAKSSDNKCVLYAINDKVMVE